MIMAISEKRKEIIIAAWKAGRFKSYYAAAKHYKMSQTTIKKLLGDIAQSNVSIVELKVEYMNELKRLSNLEIQAVEKAAEELNIEVEVEYLVHEATLANVKAIRRTIEEGKVIKVVTEGIGGGMIQSKEIAVDMTPADYKAAQEGLDKALITVGKAARHAPKVNISSNNDETNIKAHIEYIIEEE